MTDEEKKVIEIIKYNDINRPIKGNEEFTVCTVKDLETVLNLVEKQEKIIDLMAEDYSKYQKLRSYHSEITETAFGIISRINKQYFEKKASENK